MPQFDDFSDTERRHLVHVYGALQTTLQDELEYAFEGFAPLDETTQEKAWEFIYGQLAALMAAMHPGEAAKMQAVPEAWWADFAAQMAHVHVSRDECR